MQKLVLVDGSSYLFRAYHALPPLTNSKGQATGAVFGVSRMLKNLYHEQKPNFFAVVFDAKGKTFRHQMYGQYKANRPSMPEDLAEQITPLHAIIKSLGFPLLIIEEVEADDVIATLAIQAQKQNIRTVISASDKDLTQLVNSHTTLIDTMNNSVLDEMGVERKFGVKPRQIADFLTLTGDTSDNIPGVDKVGPKTAAKWLKEYQTLDNLIANAEKVPGKIGENLRAAIPNLGLSKKLVTLKYDVDIGQKPDELTVKTPDNVNLYKLYSELEFNSWLNELGANPAHKETTATKVEYETILNGKDLDSWIKKLKKHGLFAIDTETTSLNIIEAELVGISFSVEKSKAAYLPLTHNDPQDSLVPKQLNFNQTIEKLRPVLENPKILKVGQNLKYDESVLAKAGIKLRGIGHDSMLQSYVLNSVSSGHDLDTLAIKELGVKTQKYEDVAGKGKNQLKFNEVNIKNAAPYAAEDADISLRLCNKFLPELKKIPALNRLYQDIEIPLISVISRMERNGVYVDSNKLEKLSQEMSQEILQMEQKAFSLAKTKFNLASPKQIQAILFEKMDLPIIRKTAKGQPSTAEDVLQELAEDYQLPRIILKHRSLSKLKSTYTDKLPQSINLVTGRIHTSYHQAVTATGRLSSSNPNLQNIPIRSTNGKKIRAAFVAEKNHVLLAADYSQIELRIMAHLSSDESLLKAFANNVDIHAHTASEVFACKINEVSQDMRSHAKAVNFGLIYGMSAFGLGKQLGISRSKAQEYIDLYFARYPGVKTYMDKTRIKAREQGYVETVFGRRLYLPDIKSKNSLRRQYAERTAINAPMQGTAADIIKIAMLKVQDMLDKQFPKALLIMQVHDELVLEIPKAEAKAVSNMVQDKMQNAAKLKVPLLVDTGIADNWNDAH